MHALKGGKARHKNVWHTGFTTVKCVFKIYALRSFLRPSLLFVSRGLRGLAVHAAGGEEVLAVPVLEVVPPLADVQVAEGPDLQPLAVALPAGPVALVPGAVHLSWRGPFLNLPSVFTNVSAFSAFRFAFSQRMY